MPDKNAQVLRSIAGSAGGELLPRCHLNLRQIQRVFENRVQKTHRTAPCPGDFLSSKKLRVQEEISLEIADAEFSRFTVLVPGVYAVRDQRCFFSCRPASVSARSDSLRLGSFTRR